MVCLRKQADHSGFSKNGRSAASDCDVNLQKGNLVMLRPVHRDASVPEPASEAQTILSVQDLCHGFTVNGKAVPVFQGVSLDIAQGEFLGVLGPSGCGKSTLLQIIAGLLPSVSGRVMFEGHPIVAPPEDMVYLFQQYNKSLLPWRSTKANVGFALEGRGLSRQEKNERCLEYLRIVGLADFADHFPWQLSGGMQQRVAIARALAANPKVLLMDEPFSAVDALTRLELQTLVLDVWAKSKLTIVMVTHDVDEAVFMADRIAMLGERPSSVATVVETGLPRPRDPISTRELPRFLKLRHSLLNMLLKRPNEDSPQRPPQDFGHA